MANSSLFPLKGHQARLRYVLFCADDRPFISASEDGTCRWWTGATGQADWNPGGKLLVWQQRPGTVRAVPVPTLVQIDARGSAP